MRGSAGKLKVTSVPSHHYSHALSAFMLSGFSESLVLVMDAGGNTYSADDTRRWWETPREQTSLWYGKNSRLYLLERREFLPYEVGYGECYRAFTHFLGWGSHTNSGNTMALAALGNHRSISENGIWDITSLPMNTIRNEPDRPIEMVVKLLKRIGCKIPPRNPFEKIEQAHKDLAAWLQFSLVANVKEYLRKSFSLYANNNVCLSGGVAFNCVMNSQIAEEFGKEHVFVTPFSGDVGQCVGNALFARSLDLNDSPIEPIVDTFLGPEYPRSAIEKAMSTFGVCASHIDKEMMDNMAASELSKGKVIALFTGRSEFGPRALGHRSVLGDPRSSVTLNRIKKAVKGRDDFMPLAPIVLPSLAMELDNSTATSETMVFAPKIPQRLHGEFSGALHFDGTSRLQVSREGERSHRILELFFKITGSRALINTSFNRRGEPIVETPVDAIKTFLNTEIDYLILEDFWLSKK